MAIPSASEYMKYKVINSSTNDEDVQSIKEQESSPDIQEKLEELEDNASLNELKNDTDEHFCKPVMTICEEDEELLEGHIVAKVEKPTVGQAIVLIPEVCTLGTEKFAKFFDVDEGNYIPKKFCCIKQILGT